MTDVARVGLHGVKQPRINKQRINSGDSYQHSRAMKLSRMLLKWRWGELNPRPLLWSCAFYGCIQ